MQVEELFAPGRRGRSNIWDPTPDGRYSLALFEHGRGQVIEVEIDERVPVKRPGPRQYYPGFEHLAAGLPIFAKPGDMEFWPLLVEKAMAKLFGGYAALSGGHESAAFRAFTGCSRQESWKRCSDCCWQRRVLKEDSLSRFIIPRQAETGGERMWELLEEWTASHFLLATSISTADNEAERRRGDGLIEQHAYSVLAAMRVGEHRLLKLRNPWGSDAEWTGRWSDDSDMWERHPRIAEALGFQKAADGIFWMDWHDFSRVFNTVVVSHKSMRTGPGLTRRQHWRDERRLGGVASMSAVPPPPHQPSLTRMDTDEKIAAAIALSLQDTPSADMPLQLPAAGSLSPSCPLHGPACSRGPFSSREALRLHVNIALDEGEAEVVEEVRSVMRARTRV